MRLIDADELLKKIKEISHYDDYDVLVVDWDDMIICIDNAPTIDAEPVVRCCDCKYLQCNMRQDGYLPLGVDEYECRWCGSCDPTDFCSYGERREE